MGGDARHATLFAANNVGARHPARVLSSVRCSDQKPNNSSTKSNPARRGALSCEPNKLLDPHK